MIPAPSGVDQEVAMKVMERAAVDALELEYELPDRRNPGGSEQIAASVTVTFAIS